MLRDALINWFFTMAFLPLTLLLLIGNFGMEFVRLDQVKIVLEFVFIGMLPLIIVLFRKEDWGEYGLTTKNWGRSLSYGMVAAAPSCF